MHAMSSQGGRNGGPPPTTIPPPFDPEEFARESEMAMRAAKPASTRAPPRELTSTAEQPVAPPLNRKVRVNVPLSDLAWFELSEPALALAERMDGTTTLLELMEGDSSNDMLKAIAQLQQAGVLEYEG